LIASDRTLKNLVIVDDATHAAAAIASEHAIGGDRLTRASAPSSRKRPYPHASLQ
jgi:hypothetical protein